MGRKTSSSFDNNREVTRPRSSSVSTPGVDIDACNTLLNHFLHDKDSDGRTFLHHAVHTVSSNASPDQKADAYYLMDAIFKRAKELDKVAKDKGRGAPISHMHKLMLTKDEENGYTPCHYAILQRDLTSLMLMLKHASAELGEENCLHNQQMQHPLRLLDGWPDDEGICRVMKDLAAAVDNEGLSCLRLLGAASTIELEKCRQTMHWSYLKQIWKKQTTSGENAADCPDTNPRRHRHRMISFGDERDYLNNDVEAAPVNRRPRNGSFHVEDMDAEEDEDDAQRAGVDNDLLPLGDVGFSLLVEPESNKAYAPEDVLTVDDGSVDYGCELYTFGRADHGALGVPQFGTGDKRDRQFVDGFESKRNAQDKNVASHKPRRVEAFALGDMRREWSDPKVSASIEKDAVDSPVVAVAAGSHHTLAVTRGGRLFAFGLGKGGRLGTGDETHRPLPTRILGPLAKRIVASIAAAENHSLCVTAFDGGCYAWGANGFGQLGMPSEQQERLSPRRVDDLKSVFIVSVAAGARHSVALSKEGDVFCWGDNKSGQCAGSSPVSSSPSNSRPTRVEALTSRTCIAISASEFSSLALTRPPTNAEASLASLPVNVVFGWGHGSHVPMKVYFPTAKSDQSSAQNDSSTFSRTTCVNPVSIACAKYHNVAISGDGRVYTWGVSSESLGLENRAKKKMNWKMPSNSVIASPQLVVGMLPENGGGRAVAVAASESHSAVITGEGHLFTWGSSYGNNTLGHKGVKYQPNPRKVKRVHRAVGLAAAKEHTALLIGTSFPRLPHTTPSETETVFNPLALKDSVALEISRSVDFTNVLPISCIADNLNSKPLLEYCKKFIKMNLDGVLGSVNMIDLESWLANRSESSGIIRDQSKDDVFHPFLFRLAVSDDWMQNSHNTLRSLKGCIEKQKKKSKKKTSTKFDRHSGSSNVVTFDKSTESSAHPIVVEIDDSKKSAKKTKDVDVSSRPKSPSTKKFFCSVCAISCPDSASYTLHMSGRKHRNRVNHTQHEEEKEVAEQMINMKRMQLMEAETQVTSSQIINKQNAWDSPYSVKLQMNSPSVSADEKPRSNSLLGIMNEELRNSTPMRATPKVYANKSRSDLSGMKLTYTPEPSTTTPNSSISLGAFIPKDHIQTNKPQIKARWAAHKPAEKSSTPAPHSTAKSFFDIQKEEQNNRQKEDHMCHLGGNKWFVQQRDRAASIEQIQRKEQEEAEWEALVADQRRIEEEIARDAKTKAKKFKSPRKRQQRQKKPANSTAKAYPLKP